MSYGRSKVLEQARSGISRDEEVRDPGDPGTLPVFIFPGIPGIRENFVDSGYGYRSTDTPIIVNIPSDNRRYLHPTVFPPPVPSMEEGIRVRVQSEGANAIPFRALPIHSNVCEEPSHSLSKT
jgi:hypothetical protein